MSNNTQESAAGLEGLLTITDVVQALHISKGSWYREIRRGNAPRPVKIGDSSRWAPSAVREYIAAKLLEAEA